MCWKGVEDPRPSQPINISILVKKSVLKLLYLCLSVIYQRISRQRLPVEIAVDQNVASVTTDAEMISIISFDYCIGHFVVLWIVSLEKNNTL